jgi:hypothetical protein
VKFGYQLDSAKEDEMAQNPNEMDLKDRVELIESMLATGRHRTQMWGWTFVLWGVAYYAAIAWSAYGNAAVAWPVTMIAAALLTGLVASRMKGHEAQTTISRAISSIWIAMGISLFVLLLPLNMTHRVDAHISIAIVSAVLGTANAASGLILKWKMQIACAIVWWTAAVAACFGTGNQCSIVFLVAIFFCQIVFGIYAMICEAQRRQHGAVHA